MRRGAPSPMMLSSCPRWQTRSAQSRTVSGLSGRFSPMLSPICGTCLSRPHQTKSRRPSGPGEVTPVRAFSRSPVSLSVTADRRGRAGQPPPVPRPATSTAPTRPNATFRGPSRRPTSGPPADRELASVSRPRPPRVSRHPAVPEPVLEPRRHPGVPSGLPPTRRHDPRPTSPPRATGRATCTTDEDASAMAIEEDPVGGT